MNSSDVRRDVVVITGASAGLGRAIANRFAASRARLAITARGQERLELAKSELEALGAEVLIFSEDVADPDATERVAERVERELGPIDIWINNATVSVFSPVKQMEAAEYRRVTEVTYLGFVYGTLAALRRMLPRNRGVIIQIGSALAYRGIPLQSAYCAGKHAIMGFHESLLSELIHDGSAVRTTMVQMPALNTPQFNWSKTRLPKLLQPLGPVFQPEVGAEAVFFAAYHDVGRELLVGWPTVKAVEGNKIVAGYIDRKLAREAFTGQQSSEPVSPDYKDNLWQPAPGNWGAHGRFDRVARWKSTQLRLQLRLSFLAEALKRFFGSRTRASNRPAER